MLEINIIQCGCNLAAETEGVHLFEFDYRDTLGWCFWVKGTLNPIIKKESGFPWEFFLDLCRSVACIYFEQRLQPDARVASGRSLVDRRTPKPTA